MSKTFNIGDREVGDGCIPLVIAEIGINLDGNFEKSQHCE